MRKSREIKTAIQREAAKIAYAKQLGLAWALGIDSLYKFKGYRGEQRAHVHDMIERSRVYFSRPDQFNDPYDVAPVLRLAGDTNDPAFVAELEAYEHSILIKRGMDEAQIVALRQRLGQPLERLASEAGTDIRKTLTSSLRIFCFSAEQCHPLQWAHYADQHRGLCLHFRCRRGALVGLARQVHYRADRQAILLPLDRQSDDEIVNRMALVKADFWGYEREFRVLASVDSATGVNLRGNYADYPPDVLTGITLGMRMLDDDRDELLRFLDAHRPELPVWKAVEDEDRFWMQIEQVR